MAFASMHDSTEKLVAYLVSALAERGITVHRFDVAITGTSNPDHLRSNVTMVKNDLPIPPETMEDLHRRFEELGQDWDQQV